MISFSDASEAEPRSQSLTTVLLSLTWRYPISIGTTKEDRTDQDIVGLDVGMHDIHLLQQAERQEELMGVRPNGFDVEADVLAEALHDFAQVHAREGRQRGP